MKQLLSDIRWALSRGRLGFFALDDDVLAIILATLRALQEQTS